MMTRYLASVPVGLLVTTGLLYLMQFLIEISEAARTDAPRRPEIQFVDPPEDTPTLQEEFKPKRPDPPPEPPLMKAPEDTGTGKPSIGVRPRMSPPAGPLHQRPELGFSNNALINIIAVQPSYPVAAARQALDGFVVVQFDVTEMGTVDNVAVIESSNRIFEKSAVAAAYRFRYKARMVDGTALRTEGIRQLFRFEMDRN
jgi:protein TonB